MGAYKEVLAANIAKSISEALFLNQSQSIAVVVLPNAGIHGSNTDEDSIRDCELTLERTLRE